MRALRAADGNRSPAAADRKVSGFSFGKPPHAGAEALVDALAHAATGAAPPSPAPSEPMSPWTPVHVHKGSPELIGSPSLAAQPRALAQPRSLHPSPCPTPGARGSHGEHSGVRRLVGAQSHVAMSPSLRAFLAAAAREPLVAATNTTADGGACPVSAGDVARAVETVTTSCNFLAPLGAASCAPAGPPTPSVAAATTLDASPFRPPRAPSQPETAERAAGAARAGACGEGDEYTAADELTSPASSEGSVGSSIGSVREASCTGPLLWSDDSPRSLIRAASSSRSPDGADGGAPPESPVPVPVAPAPERASAGHAESAAVAHGASDAPRLDVGAPCAHPPLGERGTGAFGSQFDGAGAGVGAGAGSIVNKVEASIMAGPTFVPAPPAAIKAQALASGAASGTAFVFGLSAPVPAAEQHTPAEPFAALRFKFCAPPSVAGGTYALGAPPPLGSLADDLGAGGRAFGGRAHDDGSLGGGAIDALEARGTSVSAMEVCGEGVTLGTGAPACDAAAVRAGAQGVRTAAARRAARDALAARPCASAGSIDSARPSPPAAPGTDVLLADAVARHPWRVPSIMPPTMPTLVQRDAAGSAATPPAGGSGAAGGAGGAAEREAHAAGANPFSRRSGSGGRHGGSALALAARYPTPSSPFLRGTLSTLGSPTGGAPRAGAPGAGSPLHAFALRKPQSPGAYFQFGSPPAALRARSSPSDSEERAASATRAPNQNGRAEGSGGPCTASAPAAGAPSASSAAAASGASAAGAAPGDGAVGAGAHNQFSRASSMLRGVRSRYPQTLGIASPTPLVETRARAGGDGSVLAEMSTLAASPLVGAHANRRETPPLLRATPTIARELSPRAAARARAANGAAKAVPLRDALAAVAARATAGTARIPPWAGAVVLACIALGTFGRLVLGNGGGMAGTTLVVQTTTPRGAVAPLGGEPTRAPRFTLPLNGQSALNEMRCVDPASLLRAPHAPFSRAHASTTLRTAHGAAPPHALLSPVLRASTCALDGEPREAAACAQAETVDGELACACAQPRAIELVRLEVRARHAWHARMCAIAEHTSLPSSRSPAATLGEPRAPMDVWLPTLARERMCASGALRCIESESPAAAALSEAEARAAATRAALAQAKSASAGVGGALGALGRTALRWLAYALSAAVVLLAGVVLVLVVAGWSGDGDGGGRKQGSGRRSARSRVRGDGSDGRTDTVGARSTHRPPPPTASIIAGAVGAAVGETDAAASSARVSPNRNGAMHGVAEQPQPGAFAPFARPMLACGVGDVGNALVAKADGRAPSPAHPRAGGSPLGAVSPADALARPIARRAQPSIGAAVGASSRYGLGDPDPAALPPSGAARDGVRGYEHHERGAAATQHAAAAGEGMDLTGAQEDEEEEDVVMSPEAPLPMARPQPVRTVRMRRRMVLWRGRFRFAWALRCCTGAVV